MSAPLVTKSTTLEGQALEILVELQKRERAQSTNALDKCKVSFDLNSANASCTFNPDILYLTNTQGLTVIEAVPYLT